MSTESESSEFIGWYSRNGEVEGLKARNAKLVAALKTAQLYIVHLQFNRLDEINDKVAVLRHLAEALAQQSTEKP